MTTAQAFLDVLGRVSCVVLVKPTRSQGIPIQKMKARIVRADPGAAWIGCRRKRLATQLKPSLCSPATEQVWFGSLQLRTCPVTHSSPFLVGRRRCGPLSPNSLEQAEVGAGGEEGKASLEVESEDPAHLAPHAMVLSKWPFREGDLVVVLESGMRYQVHASILERVSQELAKAMPIHKSTESSPSVMQLCGVTDAQFLILLHAAYEYYPNICDYNWSVANMQPWAVAQQVHHLLDLATASHALGCTEMVTLADNGLAQQISALLSSNSALGLCRQALQLGLKGLQVECALAIVESLPTMSGEESAEAAGMVVSIWRAARLEVVEMLCQIDSRYEAKYPHASQGGMHYYAKSFKAELQGRIGPQVTEVDQA